MSDKKKYYMTNKELLAEIVSCQKNGVMSEKLGEMYMLLSERNINHRHFVRYPFRDDLISVAVTACCAATFKFNPDKSNNPFAFFTTCIRHSCYQYLKKHYNQTNIKNKLKVDNGLNPDYSYADAMEKLESPDAEMVDPNEALLEIDEVGGSLFDEEFDSINADEPVDIFGMDK